MTHTTSTPKIEAEPRPDTKHGTFTALRLPSFAWFISGTTFSNAAQWIQNVTLSWLVYDLTASGAMLGTLNLTRSIATIGLAPIAGVAIDRFSRRGLLYATSIWLFAISFGFGLVLLGNPNVVWPLFLFSFLGGIGQAVSMPLRQTVIFSVVPRSLAPSAVALMQTGWAVMRSLGPAIGGFLILWFGPAGNFFVQAGAYALVAVTVIKLTLPYEKIDVNKAKSHGSFREGWTYIAKNPTTRAFLFMSWVLLLSLSFIAYAVSTTLWMAFVFMVLAGFFEMIYLATNMTLMQLSIPDSVRGRVTGIISLRSGLMPVGAFIAGVGADLIGPRPMTIILGVICGLIAVIVFFASPIIRDYRLSEAIMAEVEAEVAS